LLGALAGAALVATLGMGPAYSAIAFLYGASFLLTLRVAGAPAGPSPVMDKAPHAQPTSAWHDLREAAGYIKDKPQLLSAIYIAVLVNLTAFPLVNGLLPYVAKEVYGTDQTGLGYMVAGFALGALLGSIVLSRYSSRVRAGRMIIVFCLAWYAMTLLFAHTDTRSGGILMLVLAGFAQSLGMVSMSAMLLRNSADRLRGRIMGIRMLAIYGVPVGLLVSGPLIGRFGYPATATAYCVIGLVVTLLIAVRWREHLWKLDAPANSR
jgi:predicted MFS family arabinose efflux permease